MLQVYVYIILTWINFRNMANEKSYRMVNYKPYSKVLVKFKSKILFMDTYTYIHTYICMYVYISIYVYVVKN